MAEEARLPTGLWIDLNLHTLNDRGIFYYIINRGNHASGVILLKLNGLDGKCTLLLQQRDIDGNLGWIHAMGDETLDEGRADEYIKRAVSRDPDLWVIEIEDPNRQNPFEGKLVE